MELSPLAREKLARIGELSSAEKERLKFSEQLAAVLADYFTDRINADEFWLKLKEFKDRGQEFMVKEAQLRLLGAISLGGSHLDFERCRRGILACETLQERNRCTELELALDSLEALRQQYQREKEETFNSMREGIQKQVEMAARQVVRQVGNRKVAIDVNGSVDASVKASPQWREFLMKHEKVFGEKFDACLAKVMMLIQ